MRGLSNFLHEENRAGSALGNLPPPIGPIVVPFGGSYLEFHKVIPKRNYYGACKRCPTFSDATRFIEVLRNPSSAAGFRVYLDLSVAPFIWVYRSPHHDLD